MTTRTDSYGRPTPSRPIAINPDALPALRNMVLNGYQILDPEGYDVSGLILDIYGVSR